MNDNHDRQIREAPQAAVDEFDLAGLDEAYASAPNENEFEALPDGSYEAVVERVELKRSKTSGRKMMEWELRILGPKFVGRKVWKYTLLETPDNVVWAKKDFHRVGLDLPRLSDLPSRLNELLDVRVEIDKKTRGDFEDIYFRKRLTGTDADGQAPRVF